MIPITIVNGIPYMTFHPCTDQEWVSFPHGVLTLEADWDSTFLGMHEMLRIKSGMSLNLLLLQALLTQHLMSIGS